MHVWLEKDFFTLGDGKTFYIQKLKEQEGLKIFGTIIIDESFSIEQIISDLRKLYNTCDKKVKTIGIFFNFTVYKTEVWTCDVVRVV
jgi:hypothetical protein